MKGKTAPLSREGIAAIDGHRAKFLLLAELIQIPEFSELWAQSRQTPETVMQEVKAGLEGIGKSLSPEARGALLMGDKADALYEAQVLREVEAAGSRLEDMKRGYDYRSRLEALVEPLGVPDLADYMMTLDMKQWGIDRLFAGAVTGAASDLLEATIFRGLTDLNPLEALSETRGSVGRRLKRKVSPLSKHMKRYALQQRVSLWVRNVVYGESIDSIAGEVQRDEKRLDDTDPVEWIKREIREASRVLEAKRLPGRPRKGGVLRYWKLMAN